MNASRPTPLRLVGFLCTAAGGLLVALGSLQTWATTSLQGDAKGVLTSVHRGTDLLDGKVLLALGVLMLLWQLAMRGVGSAGARRSLAVVILAAGLAAAILGTIDVARAKDRFTGSKGQLDQQAAAIAAQSGEPVDLVRGQLLHQYDTLVHVKVGIGLWLVIVGGLLGAAGGALGLAWASTKAAPTLHPAAAGRPERA